MQEFITWLVETREIAKPSAKVYASRAKKVMSELPEELDEDTVRAYLINHPSLRTAYRVYAEWAAEVKHITLPVVTSFPAGRPPMTEKKAKAAMPEAVLDAILSLMETVKLSATSLKRIYWGQLTHVPKKQRYDLPHPDYKNTWLLLPEREVDIIREWAQPDEGGLMLYPFIPKEPQSTEGADWKTLTPTLAARRRSQSLSESV
jgi:hypothetical protein